MILADATLDVDEVFSILERLHPDSLLLERNASGLDAERLEGLWSKVAHTYDPPRRLATLEYLLLLMHQASEGDRSAYLTKVFLPWVGIKRRLANQMQRIVRDIVGIEALDAYSEDDAAHIATKVYRPLVADIFDPYMTLLTATYAFIDGSFINIETSNLNLGERNKAELVEARIRQFGGPTNLLEGYDPTVRNALSHAGSDGVLYEPRSVLFRNIKRSPTPIVESRRWSHDELHCHVIWLLELFMSIDAAVEIFGIDSLESVADREVSDSFVYHALDRDERLSLSASISSKLEQLQTIDTLSEAERFDLLSKIFFLQCGERGIPCTSAAYNGTHRSSIVVVPIEAKPNSDDEIRQTTARLIRYLILARSVYGKLFDQFVVDAEVDGASVMRISLPGQPLDEYIAEDAGLVDLLGDASIWLEGTPFKLVFDPVALAEAEDVAIGPRHPRRGQRISN
jgi:hypothetical protein